MGTKRAAEGEKSLTCVVILSRGDGSQEPRYRALTDLFGVTELAVFVLDKGKKPLIPCSEKRARQLLERRRAVVHKMYPFTIRLKERPFVGLGRSLVGLLSAPGHGA
jgi:hypothetical protein